VRQALTLLFDFEWINRNYFFGLYGRSAGFFAGSELSAYGRAPDARERELLQPFASHMPADILDGSYRLPVSDGSGRDRTALRTALNLLSEAGYELDGTVLRRRATKTPLTFEILVTTRDQERIALAFKRDLKRAGIEASVRAVDAVQFDQRRLGFDFDMIQNRWDQSLSPGNEQFFYWGSEAADNQGTRNYMGAKDPAIDTLIAANLGVDLVMMNDGTFSSLMLTSPERVQQLITLWQTLAQRYANRNPELLMFEIMNEPPSSFSPSFWDGIERQVIQAIRPAAPQHTIIATSVNWSDAIRCSPRPRYCPIQM